MKWLRRFTRRPLADKRLDAELRFHLDQATADNVADGLSPEEARRRARIELGGLEQVKERCRDTHWENRLDTLYRDFRYAIRNLSRDRPCSPDWHLLCTPCVANCARC